jgi:hypothetical protein
VLKIEKEELQGKGHAKVEVIRKVMKEKQLQRSEHVKLKVGE